MPRFALFLGMALATVGTACTDRRDITPLMAAARTGDLVTMRRLLDEGENPYQRDVLNGWTPLFHAIHKGQIEAVRLLLDRGVNPNQGARGNPAEHFAKQSGQPAIAELLLQYGARPDTDDAEATPLRRLMKLTSDTPLHQLLQLVDEVVR